MDIYGDAKVFDIFTLLEISPFGVSIFLPTYLVCELFSEYIVFVFYVFFFIFIGVKLKLPDVRPFCTILMRL